MTRQSGVSWCDGEQDFIFIHGLYVAPAERGQGVARRILSKSIGEIRTAYPELHIEIDARADEETTDIERLVAFYKGFGFQVVKSSGDVVCMRMG